MKRVVSQGNCFIIANSISNARFDSLLASIKPPKPILPEIRFTVVAQMLRIPPLGAQVLIRATQVGVCAECVVSQAARL